MFQANACSGCTRCTCTAEGEWDCNVVLECPGEEGDYEDNRHNIGTSLDILYDGKNFIYIYIKEMWS